MSADNGYIVSRTIPHDAFRYGIFYQNSGSTDHPDHPNNYTDDKAMQVFSNPIAAIVKAHRINSLEPTEYGVHVNSLVIKDAEKYLSMEPIKKNYGPA